jgi:hypothetical protein
MFNSSFAIPSGLAVRDIHCAPIIWQKKLEQFLHHWYFAETPWYSEECYIEQNTTKCTLRNVTIENPDLMVR